MPKLGNNLSSQVLEIQNEIFLIDCGEGTQLGLRKNKIKFSRIKCIFISHLHGDHYFGLIGLISTFSLLNRTADLHIYGPLGLKDLIINQIKASGSWTKYRLIFHILSSVKSETIFISEYIEVSTIPLSHRIYTNGFLFSTVSTKRKINVNKLTTFNLKPFQFQQLQNGESINLDDGRVLENEVYTIDPERPKKYAYCSDTAYFEPLIPLIKKVDLLYHESTFIETNSELAKKTKHSTAFQAATIASKAMVKKLILGHFSNRYPDKKIFIEEASKVYENVILAEDLKTFSI